MTKEKNNEHYAQIKDKVFSDEYDLDKSSRLSVCFSRVYLTLHFVIGFFVLSSAYSTLVNIEGYNEIYSLKASVETGYLLAGVIWGNVGWDGFNRIKSGAKFSEIAKMTYGFTIPVIFIVITTLRLFYLYSSYKDAELCCPFSSDKATDIYLDLVIFLVSYGLLFGFSHYRKKRAKKELRNPQEQSDQAE